MQKKLIALAVAGLVSGAAFAQTNVTVYGVVDVGYQYNKSEDNKFSGIESGEMSGSRIGFRTTEALGNGLSAIAQAEFGFKADTNSGLNTVRNAWVGLKHDQIGAFTAGRQNSVAYDWIAKGYASDITGVHPSNLLVADGTVGFAQLNSGDRVNNSIKYQTPNWNGFEVRAVYGFGEKVGPTQDTSDDAKYSLGAAYKNGPIDVALIYAGTAKDDGVANDGSINGWSLGGSYDFKVVKVFAQYQAESNKDAGADTDKAAWTIGARVPVTKAGTAIVEYVNAKADFNNASKDAKASGWGIGYEHAFSKRTVGYTSLSYISNNELTNAGFNKVGAYDESSKAFNIGASQLLICPRTDLTLKTGASAPVFLCKRRSCAAEGLAVRFRLFLALALICALIVDADGTGSARPRV